MWHFQRIDPLSLISGLRYISAVGAGGKSSLLEYLARRAAMAGKTAILTTTTKIYAKEPFALFADVDASLKTRVTRVGKTHEGEKLTGLTFAEVSALGPKADAVLIEADGAKHCPLKYPSPHEPVIPPFSDRVFVVAGLDALGGPVDETIFRWERYCGATGLDRRAAVSEGIFVSLFSEHAMFKDVDPLKCTVVLNKLDVLGERKDAFRLAKEIIKNGRCGEVIVSSMAFELFYRVTLLSR